MHGAIVRHICLIICLVLVQAKAPLSLKGRESQLNSTRANTPFNPCRTTSKVTMAKRKLIIRTGLSVVSFCGLRVIPLLEEDWGPPAKIVHFLPYFKHLLCMVARIAYGPLSNAAGRLPQSIVQNGTQIYSTANRLIAATLADNSSTPNVCIRNRALVNHGERYCYSKRQVLQFIDFAIPCIQEAMEGSVPEHADFAIHGVAFMFKTAASNGLLKYMSG